MWLFHIFLNGPNIGEKKGKENSLGRTFGELISFNSTLCVMQKKFVNIFYTLVTYVDNQPYGEKKT
jgi:hypothetical protein